MSNSTVIERRKHRAEVALTLLQLHREDALQSPAKWRWRTLEVMPRWCLLDAPSRQRLQGLCGAMLQGPKLGLWVHKEALLAAHALIGQTLFDQLMYDANNLVVGSENFPDNNVPPCTAGQARACLLETGAGVLLATLEPSQANSALIESLGTARVDVPTQVSCMLVRQAEALVASVS